MRQNIVLSILILCLIACRGTKKVPSDNRSGNTVSATRNNSREGENNLLRSKTNSEDTTYASSNSGSRGVASQTNGSTRTVGKAELSSKEVSEISDTDLKSMYKELSMTEDQVITFERSMREFKQTIKNSPNGEMLGTIGNEQDRQLQKILTNNQWDKYQLWKKKMK